MATIYDLIEVTTISANTTYSQAAGNILGVIDGATSTALDDGEFDAGDSILIGGVTYSITGIQEPSSSGRFTLENGTNLSFDPGSESNLQVVFLTVSNGSTVRHFIIPNDSYGSMAIDEIRTGSLTNVAGSDAGVISTQNNAVDIVCFGQGALIQTPDGDRAVEDLRIGDLVVTRDRGAQAVRAILRNDLTLTAADKALRPIAFEPGSLGVGRPFARLCVSPQHRILVSDLSGTSVLVPAKALTGRPGVRVMRGKRQVTYFHLVFSKHEIIWANGIPTESFFPGPMAMRAVPKESLTELQQIFGADQATAACDLAAPALKVTEARRNAQSFT